MRECKRHPSESQPGGGVCASCLEERLAWLWRGESFRHDAMASSTTTTTTKTIIATTARISTSLAVDVSSHPKLLQQQRPEPAAPLPDLLESGNNSTLGSVRQQLHVLGVASRPRVSSENGPHGDPTVVIPITMAADNPTPLTSTVPTSKAILEEWAAFQARRLRATTDSEPELDPESPNLESPKPKSPNLESPNLESPKLESPKLESPKLESPKLESPKLESPKLESPKLESPKLESPKLESPKLESPKLESPKLESPKLESPKLESPKLESPKLESPKTTKSSRSFDSIESLSETGGFSRHPVHPNPELRILMNAQKMRSQSMPLDFRSAEETAARVINEQADDYLDEDFEVYEVRDGDGDGDGDGARGVSSATIVQEHEVQRCFSPMWHSPKWVKVLASPMTSRNRVFPSRSNDVRKKARSSKRGARFDSSDWGFKNVQGGASPLWRGREQHGGGAKARSVFSWLQDAETIQFKKHDQTDQLTSSSSSSLTNSVSTDSWLRDLTTVGHLHEIAEELEIVEESSEEVEEEEEELEALGDVSSFGKFLLQAAQRHPHARLTRLVSAPTSQGL